MAKSRSKTVLIPDDVLFRKILFPFFAAQELIGLKGVSRNFNLKITREIDIALEAKENQNVHYSFSYSAQVPIGRLALNWPMPCGGYADGRYPKIKLPNITTATLGFKMLLREEKRANFPTQRAAEISLLTTTASYPIEARTETIADWHGDEEHWLAFVERALKYKQYKQYKQDQERSKSYWQKFLDGFLGENRYRGILIPSDYARLWQLENPFSIENIPQNKLIIAPLIYAITSVKLAVHSHADNYQRTLVPRSAKIARYPFWSRKQHFKIKDIDLTLSTGPKKQTFK